MTTDVTAAKYAMLLGDVARAVQFIGKHGMVDGAHHKQWVLDQALRLLMGDSGYAGLRAVMRDAGEEWDEGVAP